MNFKSLVNEVEYVEEKHPETIRIRMIAYLSQIGLGAQNS